jgi:hypothetical protein
MKVKFLQSRKTLALILGVVLLLLLLGALLIPGGSAKYRTQVVQANAVNYNDRLAESFTLSHVHQKENGTCYYLQLPGTTTTFAPTISINGKTEIPAYLYLEVTGPDTTLNAGWTQLGGVTGLNEGRVYAYETILTNENKDWTIIPKISIVWSKIPPKNTNSTLHIYAYMIQQESAETTAESAFKAVVQKDASR